MTEKSRLKIHLQIGFWIFMFFFVFDYHFVKDNWGQAFRNTIIELISYAFIIYVNLFLLIPKTIQRKKNWLYGFAVFTLVLVYVLVIKICGYEFFLYDREGWRNVFSMVLNVLLFVMLSSLFWYFNQWHLDRETKMKLKSESLEFELDYLRSQISPHFIFNSLNNIYALALQKHDNTAPMVSKLSHIMRYILYDTKTGIVPLDKEILALQNYIDLHMYKLPASKNMDFYKEGNFSLWTISPMLLLDFIENAFKHSNLHQDKMAWIKISAEVDDRGLFKFNTENNCSAVVLPNSGIGLKNAERQLQINYANAYNLQVSNDNKVFNLSLTIQLHRK